VRRGQGMPTLERPDAVLVIAWGNPLREDDAVGWHVLEGLRSAIRMPGLGGLGRRLDPTAGSP
jgi:hypothetical protein